MTGPVARPPLVVGLAGSPRRHGNSEQLLDVFLDGARGAGAEVRKIAIVELGLSPCRGCNACSLTGECVQRDRMSEVYEALDAADAVVVASPVFFATVPGILKVAYDRCQPYWARTHVLGLPKPARRPGALLLVRGGGDPFGFRSAVDPTRSVFAVLGLDIVALQRVAGPDSPSDMGRRPEELEHARVLGAELCRGGPDRLLNRPFSGPSEKRPARLRPPRRCARIRSPRSETGGVQCPRSEGLGWKHGREARHAS